MSDSIPPIMLDDEHYAMPALGWTCFHCGETFTTPGSAKAHFGFDPSRDPGCRIKRGGERALLMELRKTEDEIERLNFELHNEGAEALKSMRAMMGRHRDQLADAEQAGYDRGLADGRTAAAELPADVVGLVVAARIVAYGDTTPDPEDMAELDKACEAFAARVPWENEPQTTDGEAVP